MNRLRSHIPVSLLQNIVLVLLIVGVLPPAPSGPTALAADFDRLAGMVGRAEAWYLMYGVPEGLPAPSVISPATAPVAESAFHTTASETLTPTVHLPLVMRGEIPTMIERRGIWITRYDWTSLGEAPAPGTIDVMVSDVAGAGFNTILFQVRAAGDAYYTPGLEPWAARLSAGPVSETLGLDPGWDPLARMIEVGHAAGLEVHAYVNVYTAWLSPPNASYGDLWPPATSPPQMFDRFTYGESYEAHPGEYALGYTWRQYRGPDSPEAMSLVSNSYLWASPGLDQVAGYIAAVVRDIVQRYPVDGVHLDLVRYAGSAYSYDPESNAAAGDVKSQARDRWQRDRITALVWQVRNETKALRPEAIVSAAVWPYYIDKWGWDLSEGYTDYYQDSKGWLAAGAVDAIAPMLYGSRADVPVYWEILMRDFVADSGGLPVYPGIGATYADFAAISWRIETARAAGAQGHILFSYSGLNARGYWDDLAAGPYRTPAVLP